MPAPLTQAEREQLQDQLTRLENKKTANKTSAEGLNTKQQEALKDEAINKKQWDYAHLIIHNYEREIELLNGEYISAPFTNKDVLEHANSGGRLYQGANGPEPRVIPQMIGEPIASTLKTRREDILFPTIDRVTNIILNGLGPNSGSATKLREQFSPDDPSILTEDPLNSDTWYLLNDRVLVKVGASSSETTGTCSDPQYTDQTTCEDNGETWTVGDTFYRSPIIDRIDRPNAEVSISFNETTGPYPDVEVFNGWPNTERQSKTASTTDQALFDVLIDYFTEYVDKWFPLVVEGHNYQLKNNDPDMDQTAINETANLKSFLDTYISNGYPLEDGSNEIDGYVTAYQDRTSYIPSRVTAAKEAKKAYYGDRANYTKIRATLGTGTLYRVEFIKELKGFFPEGGDPALNKQIQNIKRLLAES